MTEKQMEVFFEIHRGMPREGPGGPESTRIAFSSIRNMPRSPRILDIGCGPGAQTLLLAELSKGEIDAVDNHGPFLDQLRVSASERGLGAAIRPTCADMKSLQFKEETFDLIWAEGSIFIIGVGAGLTRWRPLLKEEGSIAFTEASWLRTDAPDELRQFWQNAYPEIRTIDEVVQVIEESGYQSTGYFILPESDWWDEYYTPMLERLPELRSRYGADPAALEVVAMAETEIEMFRRYSDYYGYVFYMAEKRSDSGTQPH